MGKKQKKTKRQSKRKESRILENLRKNKGIFALVALFLGSTIAYAFLSGGSLSTGGKAAGDPPENRLPAEGMKNPYAVTQEFIDKGRATYLRLCVACHLEDGSGPPEHSVKEMAAHHTEGDYYWLATYGSAGTAMPPWKDVLTPEERWQVISYMRQVLGGAIGGEAHEGHEQPTPSATTGPFKAQPSIDKLALSENFDSLADGLKLTPEGAFWARFVNVKLVPRTPLEELAISRVEPDAFYGVKIIGMLAADYPDNTWLELHDVGYDEFNFAPRNQIGITNILSTRPFIFGHTKNVNMVLNLLNNPRQRTAYNTFEPLLGAMNENVGIAEIYLIDSTFADMKYVSLNSTKEGIEIITAYRLTNSSALDLGKYEKLSDTSLERGITKFEIFQTDDIFFTRLVSSNLTTLLNEEL